MISSKVKEAYLEGKRCSSAFYFSERRAVLKQIKKAKEPIYDIVGAKNDNHICFLPSMEEVLLKTIYEVLMPRAQRSGRNEILVPKGEKKKILEVLKSAGRLGLSFKEVEVDGEGRITKEILTQAITKRTLSLFISWTEEFTGALQPIFEIANICKSEDIFLFVDGTESVGKVFFRFQDMNIDMLVFERHNLVAVVTKNEKVLKGAIWGENFCLEEYFAMSASVKESLETMDIHPMEYSLIKNEVMDKVVENFPRALFFNKGAGYLYDRWCFAFEGVSSENLAYLLREKGVVVEYLGVATILENRNIDVKLTTCALSLQFSLMTSREQIFKMWESIVDTAKEIKEYSYE